ncbi:hypothetical protein NUW58_g7339 [Xylaria curta]|uniref:Uncharacterized protein n=1 Tax=Xylaria curta TaxID=42375 RepID=A0ACC1NIN8_9PEZI|nr:hypothetical protein NUW58_g7339 [Xylaria curta]
MSIKDEKPDSLVLPEDDGLMILPEEEGSMILSEEEKRYYRALLEWEPRDAEEHRLRQDGHPEKGKYQLGNSIRILAPNMSTKFCKGNFTGEGQLLDPEYEQACRHKIEIKERTYLVDALELTPDQVLEGQYLQHAVAITEAVILIYDVRSRDSFNLVRELHQRIQEILVLDKRHSYALILVGNKADGGEDNQEDSDRMVTEGEGYALACTIGGGPTRCAFRETSARTGENVDSVFVLLGTELLKLRRLAQQRQEQAEDIASTESMGQANGHDLDKSPKRAAKWRVWARLRSPSEDAARKNAVI